ncbi:unnamed protein product [Arctogadus glacialis]
MEWTLSSQNQYWSGDDRHSADGRRDRPKSVGPMTDLSCPEMERASPVQMQSLREFEQMPGDHTVSLGVMPTFEGGVSEKMNNQLALVEFFQLSLSRVVNWTEGPTTISLLNLDQGAAVRCAEVTLGLGQTHGPPWVRPEAWRDAIRLATLLFITRPAFL